MDVINIPDGWYHEEVGLVVLAGVVPTLLFKTDLSYLVVGMLTAEFLVGTFYINPDCDQFNSRSRNRWGKLKFIWNKTTHRGRLHDPYFWLTIFFLFNMFGYGFYVAGLVFSSLLHIWTDWFWDDKK